MSAPDRTRPPTRLRPFLAWAAVLLTALVTPLLWPAQSSAAPAAAATTSWPTTTTTRTTVCDPLAPKVELLSATATSLTLSYQAYGTASCGGQGGVTVYLNTTKTIPGARSTVGAWPSGTVTFSGLDPATDYYFYASGGGSPFSHGWQGPVSTTGAMTTTTTTTTMTPTTTTTTPTIICDPPAPKVELLSATATSLTLSYQAYGTASCGGQGGVTVYLNTTKTIPGARSTVGTWPSGTVTFNGLDPATDYYFYSSGGGSPFSHGWQGPVSTLPGTSTSTTTAAPGCTASWQALSAWSGHFLFELTVKNTSAAVIAGWQVSWTWSGGQRLVTAYSGVTGGTDSAPTVSNPNWGGRIGPGTVASTVVLAAGSPPATPPVLTCAVP